MTATMTRNVPPVDVGLTGYTGHDGIWLHFGTVDSPGMTIESLSRAAATLQSSN